jgi:DNA anti-recombination protein RmuC
MFWNKKKLEELEKKVTDVVSEFKELSELHKSEVEKISDNLANVAKSLANATIIFTNIFDRFSVLENRLKTVEDIIISSIEAEKQRQAQGKAVLEIPKKKEKPN